MPRTLLLATALALGLAAAPAGASRPADPQQVTDCQAVGKDVPGAFLVKVVAPAKAGDTNAEGDVLALVVAVAPRGGQPPAEWRGLMGSFLLGKTHTDGTVRWTHVVAKDKPARDFSARSRLAPEAENMIMPGRQACLLSAKE